MRRRDVAALFLVPAIDRDAPAVAAGRPSCTQACFAPTRAELDAGVAIVNARFPPGDVRRYGAMPNEPGSIRDNSNVLRQVLRMTARSGGRIVFPGGDWSFALDVSGHGSAPVIIEGNGSIFRPPAASPDAPAVIFADNSARASGFGGTGMQFNNCIFDGRVWGSDTKGDVGYTVHFIAASAVFYNCTFQYARRAAVYAMYGQYNEFWSCEFGACTDSPTSAACILDSHGTGAASNEVLFERCKFFSCSNFLWIKGAFLTRIRDCTFQGAPAGGMGGIVLDADATGLGAVGTIIEGCWFEINRVPHILGRVCRDVRLHANHFLSSGGSNEIVFRWCENLQGSDNDGYGNVAMSVTHPPASARAPSLTWRGGNIVPSVEFARPSAPALVDVSCASRGRTRRENLLGTTGQTDRTGSALLLGEEHGFRTGVPRGVPTPLFAVEFDRSDAPGEQRTVVLDIQLFVWREARPGARTPGGPCGRGQRVYAFIENEGDRPLAYVSGVIHGADLGRGSEHDIIGELTLEVAGSGSFERGSAAVTFRATFGAAGTTAQNIASVAVGYRVNVMGSGTFRVARL